MLLVRRSDGDWQLTKSPLQEVDLVCICVQFSAIKIPALYKCTVCTQSDFAAKKQERLSVFS